MHILSRDSNLGLIVKNARLARDLTQEQLAEQLGVGARHLMAIENEGKHPSFDLLYGLIRILNIAPESIFYPDKRPDDTRMDYLNRLLTQCADRDIRVVTELVESMIANPR
jgi:transcriptional regulator with XRE-family HTH domain